MSSTRNKLINILAKSTEQFISGQELSKQLNVSRSAIWKHMNELKKDGYIIESVAKKGYRIIKYPDKLSENTLAWGLDTQWLGKTIVHKKSLDSTQTLAHQLALDGAEHGTVIIADEQTKSRGRANRTWYSPNAKGIWMSIILRPNILPYLAPQLTLLTATVLASVIKNMTNTKPLIKWPNDILIDKKKIAGILTEMQAEQDRIQYVIIGIGININQTEEDLHSEIEEKATSLQLATEKEWQLTPIVQRILEQFESKFDQYIDYGFSPIKKDWESFGFKLNEKLQIKTGKKEFEGLFIGIAEDGALLTKNEDGIIERIYSAEIAWY